RHHPDLAPEGAHGQDLPFRERLRQELAERPDVWRDVRRGWTLERRGHARPLAELGVDDEADGRVHELLDEVERRLVADARRDGGAPAIRRLDLDRDA